MKKFLNIGILILVITSCATPDKFQVTKIGEEPEIYNQRFIYGLPRTVLLIRINFEKETFIPGPYRMFSERFIGTTDFVSKAENRWRITGVKMSPFQEPDPMHYYSVNLISGTFPFMQYMKLSSEGLIIDPNQDIGAAADKIVNEKNVEPPYFTNLSLEEIYNEVSDTLYKTIIRDSSLIRIPVIRKLKEVKTIEQKAEAASGLISEIRDLKYELLSGDANVFNAGVALETAIKELDKMEKDYLSLFIGKRYTQKYSQSFIITPSGKLENLTFMKLSPARGIMPADSPEGEPVTIEISPSGSTEVLKKNISQTPVREIYNTLYYRVPEVSNIRLVQKNKTLFESRFSIYQAGSLLDIPVTQQEKK